MRTGGQALRRAWTVSADGRVIHPRAGSEPQTRGLVLLEIPQEGLSHVSFCGINQNLR